MEDRAAKTGGLCDRAAEDAPQDPYGCFSSSFMGRQSRPHISDTPGSSIKLRRSGATYVRCRPRLSSYECRNLRERHDLTSMPLRGGEEEEEEEVPAVPSRALYSPR